MNTVKFISILLITLFLGMNFQGNAQKVRICGRITTFKTHGLNQAEVSAKKSGATVVSDSMGYYAITCDERDKLTFQAQGFFRERINLKRITVIDSLNVDLKLGDSEKSLELATGFGHIAKDKLTHAIERAETTNDYSEYASVVDIIKGRVSGVQITGNSISIRGPDTYNDQGPLIIVDGAVVDFNALQNIAPSQVKSVDVLKGASASARYGSRGMQGVIVILTHSKN